MTKECSLLGLTVSYFRWGDLFLFLYVIVLKIHDVFILYRNFYFLLLKKNHVLLFQALKNGSWVLLDELNLAPQSVLEVLDCSD